MKTLANKKPYVKLKKSRIHHEGIFAKRDIPKGTRIIEYVGERITKTESARREEAALARHKKDKSCGAVYLFELNSRYDIDGDVPYNVAKKINHSCSPNAETDIIDGKIWITAIRNIKKGEEIAYNYGYNMYDYENHPCYCGSSNCLGYIIHEDLWPKFRRKLARKHRQSNGRKVRKSVRSGNKRSRKKKR